MNMLKYVWFAAACLVASIVLATCAKAGPVEDYAAKRWAEGETDAHRVRHELLQSVQLFTTNAAPARVRSAAEKLIVQDAVPMLTTKAAWRAAPDKDAHLDAAIRAKLDGGATLAETRKCVAILAARAAIMREGRTLAGDDADEPQPPIVTRRDGEPLWRVLGAAERPTIEAVAGAMK